MRAILLALCVLTASVSQAGPYGAFGGFAGIYKSNPLPVAQASARFVEPTVVGDGVTDDTVAVQAALTTCSNDTSGRTFRVPSGKTPRITGALFIWGSCNMTSANRAAKLIFDPSGSDYLINTGISAKTVDAAIWTGRITGLSMQVVGGLTNGGGRAIYLHRATGNTISHNYLDTGTWTYSLTSSGNNANYTSNAVRINVTVDDNEVQALHGSLGGEGIGINSYDGVLMRRNLVEGVGDDPLAIHFCTNFQVLNNTATSVDGRIFVSNSLHGRVGYNAATRVAGADGVFRQGIALAYIGFENFSSPGSRNAPEDILVDNNLLTYASGAIDNGAAIQLLSVRSVTAEDNEIVNNSSLVTASGLLIASKAVVGWTDPTGLDTSIMARTHGATIQRNVSHGAFPLGMVMQGNADTHADPIDVNNNTAASFSFYSPAVESNNTTL